MKQVLIFYLALWALIGHAAAAFVGYQYASHLGSRRERPIEEGRIADLVQHEWKGRTTTWAVVDLDRGGRVACELYDLEHRSPGAPGAVGDRIRVRVTPYVHEGKVTHVRYDVHLHD